MPDVSFKEDDGGNAGFDLPMDKSAWEECIIVEDIGEQDEHRDQFFRYGDFGVEACRHGMKDLPPMYESYIIVGDVPYRIDDCCGSFESAVASLIHAAKSKRLEEGTWDEGQGKIEVTEVEFDGADIAKSSISDMIAKNRDGRKVPIKTDSEMPPIANGKMVTPRSAYRTIHIGVERDKPIPDSIKVTDGAEGCTSKKV